VESDSYKIVYREFRQQSRNACILLKTLVGAAGLEPATLCLEGKNARNICNLAGIRNIANNYAKLLVFKGFRASSYEALATASNGSMRGVGTKMGTVSSRDFQSPSRANIGTSGQPGTYKNYKTRARRQSNSGFRQGAGLSERG
jgi:hypothetical protein